MTPVSSGDKLLAAGLLIYIGLCAGLIAQKHGKNPVLYGLMSVITPLNLIILGVWAFGGFERRKDSADD